MEALTSRTDLKNDAHLPAGKRTDILCTVTSSDDIPSSSQSIEKGDREATASGHHNPTDTCGRGGTADALASGASSLR